MQDFMSFVIRHWELSAALVVVLILLVIEELWGKVSGGSGLSPQEAIHFINHEHATIIDLREVNIFQNGHIAAAVNMPLDSNDDLKKIEKYKTKALILVCSGGQKARTLVTKLRKQGFEKAYFIKGGITAWTQAELPLVKK